MAVWSSGLGRCSCGHRNPGSNPEVSPLQLFFYFLIVHYIFTCGPDFAKTKKLTQHSISSQNILFTSKSISLYTQEIIIVKEWLLVTSSLYVYSLISTAICSTKLSLQLGSWSVGRCFFFINNRKFICPLKVLKFFFSSA